MHTRRQSLILEALNELTPVDIIDFGDKESAMLRTELREC